MPGFDDRLTRELERAARPAAPDQGALFDDVTRRRATWRARRRAGQVALVAVVLAGTAGGYLGLQRAFEGSGQPASSPTPNGSAAETLAGVPFPICHPMSIPGEFGDGLDTLWVFEAESSPGAGCNGAAGAQRIGIGTSAGVETLSDRIGDIGQTTSMWPYATPDLDGNGVDEIALGIGRRWGSQQLVLFRSRAGTIRQITFCDGCGFVIPRGGSGGYMTGASCDTQASPTEVILWNVERDDRDDSYAGWITRYRLEGDVLKEVGQESLRLPTGDETQFPEGADGDFCGAQTFVPGDFPNYNFAPGRVEPFLEPSPEPVVGRDLGLGFNVCVKARLGDVQLREGVTGTAWTAARVIDGKCAEYSHLSGPGPGPAPVVVVDTDGDGVADAFTKIPCEYGCDPWPSGSTDLNGDGRHELIVTVQPYSWKTYVVFVLTDDGGIAVARAGSDGPASSGFTEGRPAVFVGGGDEGYDYSVSCANWPGPGTQLTQTDTYRPVDGQGEGTQVSVTTVQLVGSTFEILGSDSYELGPDVVFDGHSITPACGFDWRTGLAL